MEEIWIFEIPPPKKKFNNIDRWPLPHYILIFRFKVTKLTRFNGSTYPRFDP